MGGPPCVQLGCGHSAARRSLHRPSLRDPLAIAAHRASRPRATLKIIIMRLRPRQTPRRCLAHEPDLRFLAIEPSLPAQDDEIAPSRRMFIFEPGWRVGVKTGSIANSAT